MISIRLTYDISDGFVRHPACYLWQVLAELLEQHKELLLVLMTPPPSHSVPREERAVRFHRFEIGIENGFFRSLSM